MTKSEHFSAMSDAGWQHGR